MTPAPIRERTTAFDADAVREMLLHLDQPCYIVRVAGRVGARHTLPSGSEGELLAAVGPLAPDRLGSPTLIDEQGLRGAYMAGSMAAGISSVELVTALVRAGYLASFGTAGLPAARAEDGLARLGRALSGRPWAANLIHTPTAPRLERDCVDRFLAHGVRRIEASAFVRPTAELVRFRTLGLRQDSRSGVHSEHRVMAKVSRCEVAEHFLRPAPAELLDELLQRGAISAEQAELARRVPLADDLTAEADSAGHTDRRPLAVLLPLFTALRDRLAPRVRIGAAGGIGTPTAAHAAFVLGADYVVTGSVNQACVEAGTSTTVKELLARAGIADCATAPAADMFELGIDVQVLQRGSLFPGRAGQLYRLYHRHDSLDDLTPAQRDRLEQQLFRRSLSEVEHDTMAWLAENQPEMAVRAAADRRFRMAAVFRWYLGQSSRWALEGTPDRVADFQIWCGPAMGAFNAWTAGTDLAEPRNRHAATVARELLTGAAYHARIGQLRLAGVRLPAVCGAYRPTKACVGHDQPRSP
ncbi:PfaD family polyunsaturated fatty acid/polyketide biosynthesis protein [Kitasatospora sp. NPDC058046]|uniref:PfaD family polyunsaturated fatty acid/polyketide biosynthesis protein n=1 Tax=Kitasatospora sp. NPDC058046 TaxID=3346312 RepID=UPI0036DCE6B2